MLFEDSVCDGLYRSTASLVVALLLTDHLPETSRPDFTTRTAISDMELTDQILSLHLHQRETDVKMRLTCQSAETR